MTDDCLHINSHAKAMAIELLCVVIGASLPGRSRSRYRAWLNCQTLSKLNEKLVGV